MDPEAWAFSKTTVTSGTHILCAQLKGVKGSVKQADRGRGEGEDVASERFSGTSSTAEKGQEIPKEQSRKSEEILKKKHVSQSHSNLVQTLSTQNHATN